jgi:DNA-binding response OmpR family regulator
VALTPRVQPGVAYDLQVQHRSPSVVFLGNAESLPALRILLRDRQLSAVTGNCRDTDLPLLPYVDADVILVEAARCRTPLGRVRDAWRSCAPTASILVLSVEPSAATIAEAIREGADDVIGLPCSPADLLVRIHVAYRRARRLGEPVVFRDAPTRLADVRTETPAPIRLQLAARLMSFGDRTVQLGRRECAVAELLCRSPRRAVSRHEILMAVWEREYDKTAPNNLVDVYARLLRRRFSELGIERALATVRHVGYRLNAEAEVR